LRIISLAFAVLFLVLGGLSACSSPDSLMPTVNEADGEILVGLTAISAPLFPRYILFYEIEGEDYPASPGATWDWVQAEEPMMTFPEMMDFCLDHEPYASQITVATGETVLTREQLDANYIAISSCAYDVDLGFRSKPYWIPQFLEEVDACAHELGEGWAMPTEEFVMAQDSTFFEEYAAQNSATANTENTASMYFSLSLFVTGSDGQLKVATLEPGDPQPSRVRALPERLDRSVHIEMPFEDDDEASIWNTQTIVVRCFKDAI
jgi:hypothetical protein